MSTLVALAATAAAATTLDQADIEEPTEPKVSPWPEGVKFAHFTDCQLRTSRPPRTWTSTSVSACYKLVTEGDAPELHVGYSFCSTEDQLCYRTGRQVAYERYEKTPFIIPLRPGTYTVSQIRKILLSTVSWAVESQGIDLPGVPRTWLRLL